MDNLVSLHKTRDQNTVEIENLKKQMKNSNKENVFSIMKKIQEINEQNNVIDKKINDLGSKKVTNRSHDRSTTSSTATTVLQGPTPTTTKPPSENQNALKKLQEAIALHTRLTKATSSKEQDTLFDAISQITQQIVNTYKDKIIKNNGTPDNTTKEFLRNLSVLAEKNKKTEEGRVWDMCNSIYESITESYSYLDEAEKQIPGLKKMLCLDEELMKNALVEVQELFQESVSHTPGDETVEGNPNAVIFRNYNKKGTGYCILLESPQGIKVQQFVVSGDPEQKLTVTQIGKKPRTIPYEQMDDLKKILKDHTVLFAGERPTQDDPFKDIQDYSQDRRKGG